MRRQLVRGGFAVILIVALVDGVFGERGLFANRGQEQRNAKLREAIAQLEDENRTLISDVKRLREDPAAIEELARDELELMKDGELLIILRDVPTKASATR